MQILFVVPPGLPEVIPHHEATSGMGALIPTAASPPEAAFLYPPHTVASCAAVVRDAGWGVAVRDGTRCADSAEFAREAMAHPCDLLAVLVSHGTAPVDANFLRLMGLARRGAAPAPILLFGPSAHFVAEAFLAEGLADAALTGEPEGAFAEAARRTAGGALTGAVSAAALCPDRYGAGGLLADLDALPFPAWELVPWQPYVDVSLLSSRGCPDDCTYCAYTVAQGPLPRAQTPERTVAELAWLAERIPARRIQMRDSVFARDRARTAAICEGLLARGVRIKFNCESRPEHFDDELLRLLKAAGCWRVKIGLESGDPAILVALGRVRDAAAAERYIGEAVRASRTAAALGLKCQVHVMVGLPGQDAASLARTEAVLKRLPAAVQVSAKPYQAHPGTVLTAPSAVAPVDQLTRLEQANQAEPDGLRRIWRLLKGGTGERRSGGAGERHSGANNRQADEATVQAGSNDFSRSARPGATEAATTNAVLFGEVGKSTGKQPPQAAFKWPETRVFLTGGNGFVGGHVARALVAAGAQVIALVRPGSSLGALGELPVTVVRGDLARPGEWREALGGCEVCFHVAARYAGADQAVAMLAVNVDGTAALLAACAAAGVTRVVHTSTIGTVGRPAGPGLPDETTPFNLWDQASGYVRSKYLGEQVARAWNAAGLEVIIVKPAAPVGAGDARPSATGRRIAAALRGQVTPYPPGGVNHAPVADIAAGHLLAAQRGQPGQTYILGHRAGNLDHAAFLRLVAEAAGVPALPPRRAGSGGGLPDALTADPARAVGELGMPQSDLRAAFAEAVAWFRTHLA